MRKFLGYPIPNRPRNTKVNEFLLESAKNACCLMIEAKWKGQCDRISNKRKEINLKSFQAFAVVSSIIMVCLASRKFSVSSYA